MMEAMVTTGAINHAKLQSNHHHQQTNIQFFLQAGCPSCRPNNSVTALKGKISHSMDLLTPSSPADVPTLSLTTNSSWLPWERKTENIKTSTGLKILQAGLSMKLSINTRWLILTEAVG